MLAAAIVVAALVFATASTAAREGSSVVRCPHAKGAYACMVRELSRTLAARYAPALGVPAAKLVTRYQVCDAPHAPTRFNCSFRTETRAPGPATYVEGNVVARFARVSAGYARRQELAQVVETVAKSVRHLHRTLPERLLRQEAVMRILAVRRHMYVSCALEVCSLPRRMYRGSGGS